MGCTHPTLADVQASGAAFSEAIVHRSYGGSLGRVGRGLQPELIRCFAVALIGCAIMRAQTSSRLFERLVLRFKLRDNGKVVGRVAHGRAVAQSLELATYRLHPIVDLLAQRLI